MSSRHLPTTTAMQCFEAAARHRSFTRAAEELSLTQSAVSKQVGQLEAHLQHKLFRRVRRSLVLTPEGAIYLSDVRKVLTQIAMSTQAIMTYSGNSEVLKVATLPSFGASWLAHRLPSFMQAHPDISLEFTNRVEDFSLVEQGIDVAFFYGHGSWPELECHKLMDEEVVAVAAPSLLAQHPVGCAGDIAELPLLHLSTRPDAWHLWFAAQGLQTDRSYHGSRFETFSMLLHTAMAGGGVAVVPRFIAQQALDRGQVVLAWPYALKSASAYYLVHPEQLGELSKVRHFVQHILRS
ncbi:LysR substrate-binding domain-containing protein [Billgrantia kenyensis]|uniref:LysR family transcriptional regulator n=1 Tax=Billgrantia kenyensis TaxID=321266 RepID=A0A7V9W1T7_9GAMM|nr:LysR substrate-binding domain-containing protein [Halomonas kenyensis]MBA2779479.1 LysR family transcriptional regulator [Halomonas kenyensis]MCG6662712.1 LysR family transcriptional regulator [Halomonas kenyensis]